MSIQFDDATDDATHAVIVAFSFLGLPENDELTDLMDEINNNISSIMREFE